MRNIKSSTSSLIAWASRLKEVAVERHDSAAAKIIQQETDELKSGRFMLVVMGKVKRGKSTFCNAFLGRQNDQVAPVDKLPASSVISKFFRGPNEDVQIIYRDGRIESSSYSRIVDFVTEEKNPNNEREVESVEISGPFQGLDEQVVLVDTPGAGSIHKQHDAILHGFIPQADAVIFLVTANMPIAADELELLQQLKEQDIRKIFFAINKVDECEEEEIQDGIEHNIKMLGAAGITINKIHQISAKTAMLGNPGKSGIPEFLTEISEFLVENKGRILKEKFLSKLGNISAGLAQTLAFEIASTAKTEEELQAELSTLSDKKKDITTHREELEREFMFKWKAAADDFENAMPEAERQVKVKASEFIRDYPTLKANNLIKELPAFLTKTIEGSLAGHVAKFESNARKSVEKLELNYPSLNLGDSGGLILTMGQTNVTLLKGVAGGALAVATGYGAMAAASTVAASVAAANAAALAASTATVAAPSLIASLGGTLFGGGSLIGSALAWAGTGTATVSVPVALTTVPAWVALAGPIGWALIGVGTLAIPFALRASRLKLKTEIDKAASEQIQDIFKLIRDERIKALRTLGERILEEFELRLTNDLSRIETSLRSALDRKKSLTGVEELQAVADKLHVLIQESETLDCDRGILALG